MLFFAAKIGFKSKDRPDYLKPNEVYLEITRDAFMELKTFIEINK